MCKQKDDAVHYDYLTRLADPVDLEPREPKHVVIHPFVFPRHLRESKSSCHSVGTSRVSNPGGYITSISLFSCLLTTSSYPISLCLQRDFLQQLLFVLSDVLCEVLEPTTREFACGTCRPLLLSTPTLRCCSCGSLLCYRLEHPRIKVFEVDL